MSDVLCWVLHCGVMCALGCDGCVRLNWIAMRLLWIVCYVELCLSGMLVCCLCWGMVGVLGCMGCDVSVLGRNVSQYSINSLGAQQPTS